MCVGVWLLVPSHALARARERAVEEIPELMGRILDSQEKIREEESALAPVVERYNEELRDSRERVEIADNDEQAAEALVDYVEAYAARLEAQEQGLRAIEGPVVRMRADARELRDAAAVASRTRESPEVRESFYEDQFEGVASATGKLAERLGRVDEASTTGAVLHASWASHGALNLPVPELGPDGASAFARKMEGLFARFQARKQQLRAERQSVRRLLDLLIERQLARRLDSLFSGGSANALGEILSGEGKSDDWSDLGNVVSRSLDLPSSAGGFGRGTPSTERLDYFARGGHRDDDSDL
jgi:hypothetical protein